MEPPRTLNRVLRVTVSCLQDRQETGTAGAGEQCTGAPGIEAGGCGF